jgi:hypothetical protein
MTSTTLTSAFSRAVHFVRPARGSRILGQPHVPLLALMAPSDVMTGDGSVSRR